VKLILGYAMQTGDATKEGAMSGLCVEASEKGHLCFWSLLNCNKLESMLTEGTILYEQESSYMTP
jgi:hypothetical protein